MSQGISAALDHLAGQIEAITPKTDVYHGFVSIDIDGRTSPLEAHQHTTRFFEMRLNGFAIDDGAAGLSGRRRASVLLRVKYEVGERRYMERMVAEDASSLLLTLKGPSYDLANTGIISVIPGEPSTEPALDPTTEQVSMILNFPFDLLYLEAL